MKHKAWWCKVVFNEKCPRCWVRRFTYGYRMDPVGYMADRAELMHNPHLTLQDAIWVLKKCKPIQVDYE